MSKENRNKPAFPHEDFEYDGGDQYKVIYNGLTKREYFAAMAMQGLLANGELLVHGSKQHKKAETMFPSYAEDAVKFADALLNQLNKTP